jgi:hypothetical protein
MDARDTRNMYSDSAVNKYLQIVAFCWILLIFPSSVLWPSQQALRPRLHNTCLRSSYHRNAHRGRRSLLLTSHKPSCWKQPLLRVALLWKAPFINSPFTRLWTLLFWWSLQHKLHRPLQILTASPPSWARLLFRTRTLTVLCSRACARHCMLPRSSGDANNCRGHETCGRVRSILMTYLLFVLLRIRK